MRAMKISRGRGEGAGRGFYREGTLTGNVSGKKTKHSEGVALNGAEQESR